MGTVNPGRTNVVTTPWSTNWLTHNSDASALTDLGFSAFAAGLIGDASAAARRASIAAQKLYAIDVTEAPYNAVGNGIANDSPAIQDAITAALASGRTVFLPPGRYLLGEPLTIGEDISIVGIPNKSILAVRDAGEAAIDATGITAHLDHVSLFGLTFTADAAGCYGVRGPATNYYLAHWRLSQCRFDAELGYGIYGLLADLVARECLFGFFGTAGASHQCIYGAGTNAKPHFSNQFYGCYFANAKGGNGAVEFGLGHALQFYGCVAEIMTTRVLYTRGTTTILWSGGNFESIAPSAGHSCLFDCGTDGEGLTNRSYLTVQSARFSLTDGHATDLLYRDAYATLSLDGCNGVLPNMYYTYDGSNRDRGLFLRNNRITGELSTVSEQAFVRVPQQIGGDFQFQITPAAAAGGGPTADMIYLDDGTNTGHGHPGLRRYTGAAWEDIGQAAGSVTHDFAGGSATWNLTAAEARARYVYVSNTGGAAIAVFPRVLPGIQVIVSNAAAHAVTFRVGGSGGASVTAGKRALLFFTSTNVSKLYEEP